MRRAVGPVAVVALALAGRVEAAPFCHCEETSTVVGHQRCHRFGSRWSLPGWIPAVAIELDALVRRFEVESAPQGGEPGAPAQVVAVAPRSRLSVALFARFYLGAEGSAGFASVAHTDTHASYLDTAGLLGFQHRSGMSMFAAELAVGQRRLAVGELHDARTGVELRVRAVRWISPWMTAGVALAANLVDRGDASVGLFAAFHLRSFDAW